MERNVEPGSILKCRAKEGHVRISVVETPESRGHRRERAPVEPEPGRKLDREATTQATAELGARLVQLAADIDEPFLLQERDRLTTLRGEPAFWSDARAAARDLRDLARIGTTCDRLERLRDAHQELVQVLEAADSRRRLGEAARRLVKLEARTEGAVRELVRMGPGGEWEALVEVRPVGAGGRAARDLLVGLYRDWATTQHRPLDVLREPRADDAPALLAIGGAYPYGLLERESGLHRVRSEGNHSVARCTVAPWTDARVEVTFTEHAAIKGSGQLGGRIRSRLGCETAEGAELMLENARTLAENRDLALEVAASWAAATPVDDVVRRYELEPFKLRDVATGFTTGRRETLAPAGLHTLLCRRVDELD